MQQIYMILLWAVTFFESALEKYPTLEGASFDAGYRETTVDYVKKF